MKANDYIDRFNKAESYDDFCTTLEKTLKELVSDTQHLIKIRHAKSDSAVSACINEVNNKWKVIVHKFNDNPKSYENKNGLETMTLVEDGFKAAFVHIYPKYSWAFDLKKHLTNMERKQKAMDAEQALREKAMENFAPYKCMPYEELTMDNIASEIMGRTYALGMYHSVGFPLESIRPLAQSIYLLRYWFHKGQINLNDVPEYEKDPDAWIHNHV